MSFKSTLNITDKQILDACRVIKSVGEKTKEQSEKALLEEDYTVNVEIDYTFEGKRKNTPVKIVLKKSLFSPEDGDSALLIVSNTAEKVKELLKEEPVPGVSKVVSIDKLRSTFVRYEQKRDLMKHYERILADEAVVPMIPSVLGNACMKAKKHPVPVKLDWETEKLRKGVEKGLNTTLFFVNCSCKTSIKVGKLSFTEDELLENIRCVLPTVFKYIDSDRIASICLKFTNSIPIPFYEKPLASLVEEKEKAAVKAPVKATAKAPAKESTKSDVKEPAKSPVKAPAKTDAKAPVKAE